MMNYIYRKEHFINYKIILIKNILKIINWKNNIIKNT